VAGEVPVYLYHPILVEFGIAENFYMENMRVYYRVMCGDNGMSGDLMSERLVKFVAGQIWLWRIKHNIEGSAGRDYALAESYCKEHLRHDSYSFDIFLRENYIQEVKKGG
jgi:hypothetical protein